MQVTRPEPFFPAQIFDKHLPIIVVQENVRASIAPGHHMVERTFEFNPQWTSHDRKLAGFTG